MLVGCSGFGFSSYALGGFRVVFRHVDVDPFVDSPLRLSILPKHLLCLEPNVFAVACGCAFREFRIEFVKRLVPTLVDSGVFLLGAFLLALIAQRLYFVDKAIESWVRCRWIGSAHTILSAIFGMLALVACEPTVGNHFLKLTGECRVVLGD